jgi:hypothetical protein
MGLQPVLLTDAMDGGRRQPDLRGQPPRAPVGRGLGLAQGVGRLQSAPYEAEKKDKQLVLEAGIVTTSAT